MAHFYASIPTSARKTVPTARGHKSTGVTTLACSWNGAIETRVWYDAKTENDVFEVSMVSHQGSGDTRCIGSGIVGLVDSYIGCGAAINKHINFGDVAFVHEGTDVAELSKVVSDAMIRLGAEPHVE